MAILQTTKKYLSTPLIPVRQSKPKKAFQKFWLHPFNFRTKRTKNVFEKLAHILKNSMNTVRHKLLEKYKGIKRTLFSKMATKQQVKFVGSNAKETNEASQVQKPSIILVALNLLHRFLGLCVRFILVKVHGEHGESMPPIDNLLLLESATSLAEKIRNKKVNCSH